ncbi:T9SS type A sorting domain-containing protein [Flavobacterium sp.]|mgnify:CR=1 FL=1|uniref:T9SS type A sorting domain-containing protein n=1 Tax=Flavobacterium sp. TaxID=239 RepID=UPI002FD8C4D4
MKTKITCIALFSALISFAQNGEYDLLREHTQTKILYNQVFEISKITTQERKKVSTQYFKQVYHEIQRADFLKRLPEYQTLKKQADEAYLSTEIPLALLISEFETLNPEAITQGAIVKNNSKYSVINPQFKLFQNHQTTLMAPLVSKTKFSNISLILKEKNIYNTTSKSIASIHYKTGNQNQWNVLIPNQPFAMQLNSTDENQIHFRVTFTNGDSKTIVSSIQLENQPKNSFRETHAIQATTITSTIPYQGFGENQAYFGQGEYEIFLDNVDQVLDKPLFVVDGFDPGDTRNTTAIYSLLNFGNTGENLADLVRNEGFDIVVVNFPIYSPQTGITIDGGADFIQRNAFVLVEIINQINSLKVGSQPNVVIGPSMGGLISRYALRYMEQNNLVHDTRLYISFDSPHLGANVPIGFQHLFNYLAFGPVGDVALQEVVNGLLRSPAAKQMLVDHLDGHLQSGSTTEFNNAIQLPTGAPNFRNAFQNELNTMGFPTQTRNVSISNGSGNGTTTGTPGMFVLNDFIINASATERARIDLRFTPPAGVSNQLVSRFRAQTLLFSTWITLLTSQANSASPATSSGFDSAPGGTFSFGDFAGGPDADPLIEDFIANLEIDRFCFIPTLSSLSISNPNWYSSVPGASATPFAAIYVPTVNEDHVTLTQGNVTFALNEILNEPLTLEEPNWNENIVIKNPIKNTIEMYSSSLLSNATVSIFDASGKIIYTQKNISFEGNHQLDINLSNGFYLIKIESAQRSFVQKLIKN